MEIGVGINPIIHQTQLPPLIRDGLSLTDFKITHTLQGAHWMDFSTEPVKNQHVLAAKQFSDTRKYDLALEELGKIPEPSGLAPRELWEFYVLKSTCLCKQNQYPMALELADKGLQIAQESESPKLVVESLIVKGTAEFRLGKHAECFESIQQVKRLISNDSDSSPKEIDLMRERLCTLLSFYSFQNLDLDELVACNTKRVDICEKYGMEYERGEAYHNLGVAYYLKGELLKSLTFYKKSLDIAKHTGNLDQKAYCLGNIGKIYSTLGELDLALAYYQQSLKVLREIKNEYVLGAFSNALGTIYLQKGDLQQSMEYFQQGYAIVKKLGNNLNISGALFTMIGNYLLQDDLASAEKFFLELEEIAAQDESRRIQMNFDFAHALILKKKGGSRNILRAGDIFRRLLAIEDLKNESYVRLQYCHLLFEELAKTNEEEILDEIRLLLEDLDQISTTTPSIELKGEIKLLQAKFDLITLSFESAQKNFVAGQKIARKYNLTRLERKISQEYDNFLLYYDKWNEMKTQKSVVSERFELSSIKDVLELTMKNKEIDVVDSSSETSKLLVIVSDNGNSNLQFYSAHTDGEEINLDLNSIRNKFDTDSVDRIKYGENTIIMNRIRNEAVYYVLEGNTYEGKQNLQKFSEDIVASQKILEDKGFPLSLKQVIEVVKNSDDLIGPKDTGDEILEKNDLITAPHRFNIIYCLFDNGRMNWSDLKKRLQMTSGNLDYHLSVLEKKGWITKDEGYDDRIIQFIDISDYGRAEFKKYLEKISLMCHHVIE